VNITGKALKMYVRLAEECRKGEVPKFYAFAFPGGYPVAYYTKEGNVLCANCATGEATRELDEDPVIGSEMVESDIGSSATICDGCGHVLDFGWDEGADDPAEGECQCHACRQYRAKVANGG